VNDEKLRERFEALRRDDARDLPGFAASLKARARRPAAGRAWIWAPACAAALGAALALWLPRPQPTPMPAPWQTGGWRMPTDVLLDVPGSQLLRELPELHTPHFLPGGPERPAPSRRMPS
jgi:hypothetical protein